MLYAELVPRSSIIVMNKEDKGVVRGAEAEVDPIGPFRRQARHFDRSDEDSMDSDSLTYEVPLSLIYSSLFLFVDHRIDQ